MRSKVLLGVLGLGLLFFLSGCMLPPPEPNLSQQSLVPLANETLSQTLELPEVQDLISRLEAEGYTPLTEAISTQEFLGSAFTFIPLAKEERSGKGVNRSVPRLPPKADSKRESEGSRGDDLVMLPPEPVIPLPLSAMAYVIHWNGGVMGVLPREGSSFQVLYPDGERTYRMVRSPGSILEQLRENERFLSFERWLKEKHPLRYTASSPLQLFVSRAFLDETLDVIYILLVLGETTYRDPDSYIHTVSEDEELESLREYLVLAKAIGEINGEVTIDPNSVWLLPRGRGEEEDPWSAGIPRREAHLDETRIVDLTIPAQLHLVHGFGEAPESFGDLRPFGFVVMRDLMAGRYRPLLMPSPRDQGARTMPPPRKPPAGKIYFGTELYIWGLADWGPENLVLKFEPQAETTLEVYNAVMGSGMAEYGTVVTRKGNAPLVYLAGFPELSIGGVKEHRSQALEIVHQAGGRYLEVKLDTVIYLLEERMGVKLEHIGELLLQLAQAEREGHFEEVYERLLPQGLESVVELFPYEDERIPVYIRALALRYAEATRAQGLEPKVSGTEVVVSVFLTELVEALFDALVDFVEGEPVPRFARVFVYRKYGTFGGSWMMRIEKTPVTLITHWNSVLRPWINQRLRRYGPPPEYEEFHSPHILDWESTVTLLGEFVLAGAQAIVGMVYAFVEHYREHYGETGAEAEAFKPTFHLLLKLLHYTDEILGEEPARDPENSWTIAGVKILSPRQAVLVMYRYKTGDWVHPRHRDIAVVNFCDEEFVDEEPQKVMEWIETTVEKFETPEWYTNDNRDSGLDIAAVVFPKELDEEEVENVRELVKGLHQEFEERPLKIGYTEPDKFGTAIFVIWWEGGELWFSCIEVGETELSEENKREIVRALALGDYDKALRRELEVHEFDPTDPADPPEEDAPSPHNEPDPYTLAMLLAGDIEEAAGEDIWDGDPDDPPMPMSEG